MVQTVTQKWALSGILSSNI